MVVSHRTSPSRHVPVPDGRPDILPHASVVTNRNITADRNAAVTPTDEALFAIYQPIYREPYDLTNPFHRTNISTWIIKFIDKCETEMARVEQLYRAGLIERADYIERTDEIAWDLQRQHRPALWRLGEIGRY